MGNTALINLIIINKGVLVNKWDTNVRWRKYKLYNGNYANLLLKKDDN